MRGDTQWIHSQVQELVMTQKQRLKYSLLIALAVLGAMFGLSYLQNTGVISEKPSSTWRSRLPWWSW